MQASGVGADFAEAGVVEAVGAGDGDAEGVARGGGGEQERVATLVVVFGDGAELELGVPSGSDHGFDNVGAFAVVG